MLCLPTRQVHYIIPQSPSHGICPSLPVPTKNANAVGSIVSAQMKYDRKAFGSSFSQLCLAALLVHPHTLTKRSHTLGFCLCLSISPFAACRSSGYYE